MVTQSQDIFNALIWNLQSVIGSGKKSKQANIHTYVPNALTVVWGLMLAPMRCLFLQ